MRTLFVVLGVLGLVAPHLIQQKYQDSTLMLPPHAIAAKPSDWSLIEPPARYDHPYGGAWHDIQYVLEKDTRARCGGIGCSYVHPNDCTSYIATDSVIPAPLILQHETGHCNGWPENHEGGHLVPAY